MPGFPMYADDSCKLFILPAKHRSSLSIASPRIH
ncbi:unnamed protein product [Brassica rapa]|uniref:Uncharacterized protein n=2 Tax=Brassica TaxID=3705 RepID=A0A8D9FX56_BRACM|nr:unnamed protein product [Brassica napus]CAG7860923.1 unnamed protein product [Brassica rapa]